MFKVIALLAIVGAASAGNLGLVGLNGLGLGYSTLGAQVISAGPAINLVGAQNGYVADVAALSRNVQIQHNGAVAGAIRDSAAINGAIAQSSINSANAQVRDQLSLNQQANTQALINANGATRNAVASAQNIAIQNGQVLARSALAVPVAQQVVSQQVVSPLTYSVGSPVLSGATIGALGYGVPTLNAASLGYGINGLGLAQQIIV